LPQLENGESTSEMLLDDPQPADANSGDLILMQDEDSFFGGRVMSAESMDDDVFQDDMVAPMEEQQLPKIELTSNRGRRASAAAISYINRRMSIIKDAPQIELTELSTPHDLKRMVKDLYTTQNKPQHQNLLAAISRKGGDQNLEMFISQESMESRSSNNLDGSSSVLRLHRKSMQSMGLSKASMQSAILRTVDINVSKWKVAHSALLLGLRLASVYKAIAMKVQQLSLAPAATDGLLSYQLKSHFDQADTQFSMKIKFLLGENQTDRTPENIETLMRLLSIRLKTFGRFSTTQRQQFCCIMEFVSYPKVSYLIRIR
jgi:hypothetical protein